MTLAPDADRRPITSTPDDLWVRHRDLATAMARRYASTPHAADIGQVADIALWTAATRFDPARGRFERYAAVTISGEIKKYLRRAGWAVRVGRQRQEDVLRLRRITDEETMRLARPPTTSDLVAATGWTAERVEETVRCDAARFGAPECHGELSTAAELAESFEAMIEVLPGPDREIVRMTYVLGMTQREISEFLAISQSMVHRRLRRAHGALASVLGS